MAMWVIAVVGVAPCQCFSLGREPDDVALLDFLDGAALALHPAAAGGDDQGLAQRVGVPGGAGAGLEGDARAADARRGGRLEQRIDAHGAGEIVGRPPRTAESRFA